MAVYGLAAVFLVANVVWAYWTRQEPLWPVWGGGLAGCLILIPGTIAGAGLSAATIAIAQLLAISVAVDARSMRLPLSITKLLYVELSIATLVAATWGDFRVGVIIGAAVWALALAPGVLVGQLGLGDVLIAPALGGWLGATAGPLIALVTLMVALALAAVQGMFWAGRVPLGPWLYVAWLGVGLIWVGGPL